MKKIIGIFIVTLLIGTTSSVLGYRCENDNRVLDNIDISDEFEKNLPSVPDSERVRWKRHKIKEGETLSHIALKYHTTVKHLRSVNGLRKNTIRAGKNLLIPIASRDRSDYTLSASQWGIELPEVVIDDGQSLDATMPGA